MHPHRALNAIVLGFAALCLSASAISAPRISVKQIAKGHFELTLTNNAVLELSRAQRRLLPMASELCGGVQPTFGRYTFHSSEAISAPEPSAPNRPEPTFSLVQQVHCTASSDSPTHPARRITPAGRRNAESIVRNETLSYLRHLVSNRTADVLAKHSSVLPPPTGWSKAARTQAFAKAGALTSINVWRVTIYVDPPSAPVPGAYGAADYEMAFANGLVECGYLVWLNPVAEAPIETSIKDSNLYRVIRQEYGQIEPSTAAAMSDTELRTVKRKLRCSPPTQL
ncbi:MAG: hypothetical protein K0U93_19105 [Gammaproteobacteria bacterium]|nr:hypothetical protein [Gammaproteobacteria bacterium]